VTAVFHVLDRTCDITQLQALATLREQRGTDGRAPEASPVCCLDPTTARLATAFLKTDVVLAPARMRRRRWAWAPRLKRLAAQAGASVLHAWGVEAAWACSVGAGELPLLVTLLDPLQLDAPRKWGRAMPARCGVAVGYRALRGSLLGLGVTPDRVAVVRGAIDFGAINRARDEGLRARVVGDAKPVVLMSAPASRSGGQRQGLWAAAIVKHVLHDLTVIVPCDSRERRRIERFADRIGVPGVLTFPDASLGWPELAACADVLMVPAAGDVCIEPLAAAMAGGLPVVGSAVPCIAEIIADGMNGLLCTRTDPRSLAARLLTALEDDTLRSRVTETARGQAYEVFGVCAFVDNYRRIYENLLSGSSFGEGVRDTATVE